MAEILGIGTTHYPGIYMLDHDAPLFLRRTLASEKTPAAMKNPANWPAAMREEWGDDEGASATARHRERCVKALRETRRAIDDFAPDFVVIWGDDQYENFREEFVPPFCVFITEEMESRPFAVTPTPVPPTNIWNEPPDTLFRHKGHPAGARYITNRLSDAARDVPYAYRLHYKFGLAHAFINTLMFLDYDRKGFNYPVVPFHVNCYGGEAIRSRGGLTALDDRTAEPDPPAPTPRACFEVGATVARALLESPWRVALIASSSWSHASLTKKHSYIYPDSEADLARLRALKDGSFLSWGDIDRAEIEATGQDEFLNWVTLAGAMSVTGQKPRIIDYVESWVLNSNKCFAIFS